MPLDEAAISTAEPKGQPYKLADEKGLYLLIKSAGKYWRLDYRFEGKRKTLALGVYPAVSLESARAARDEARALIDKGIDPSKLKQAERAQAEIKPLPLRFDLDVYGALSIETDGARLCLTPAQTSALRAFLDATRAEH